MVYINLPDKSKIANSLNNLAWIFFYQGDYETARNQLETAVDLYREIGARQDTAYALHSLGSVTRAQGDHGTTRSLFEESLNIGKDLGDRLLLAYLLADIGGLAIQEGQAVRALRLSGAAEALREAIGAPLSPDEQEKLRPMLEAARQALGEAVAAAMVAEGRAMTLEQAITEALLTD